MADGANSGFYNFGKANMLGLAFANGTITEAQAAGAAPATALPGTGFQVYFFDNGGTSAVETVDHDDYTDLTGAGAAETDATESPEQATSRNSTDFDNLVSNDTDDRGELQLADITETNNKGSTVSNYYYVVLTDANATQGDRMLYVFFGLGGGQSLTDGSTLTVQNAELRIT